MKQEKIIRINGWITFIFFGLLSIVTLLIMIKESFNIYQLITFFLFIVMTFSGSHARKFGLQKFKLYKYSRVLALISLLAGIFFTVIVPFYLINLIGFQDSFSAISCSLIMFLPVLISSSAILFQKQTRFNRLTTKE